MSCFANPVKFCIKQSLNRSFTFINIIGITSKYKQILLPIITSLLSFSLKSLLNIYGLYRRDKIEDQKLQTHKTFNTCIAQELILCQILI